ncbi:MAG TPA: STM4012 family radical SAM protein [Planctomycetota bacterium]
MTELDTLLAGDAYQGYAYSYPHKTAHRVLPHSVRLDQLWASERRTSLLLYFHIPFCQSRCGYCNLFSQAELNREFIDVYLGALQRQAQATQKALGEFSVARMAIGGGTPTLLSERELERLFHLARNTLGLAPDSVPCSVETSPATATRTKLALLRQLGVSRLSLGVQSFINAENAAVGRRENARDAHAALTTAKELQFSVLNVDLIYGLPGQCPQTWTESLRGALMYQPEELYLYPLYVRPRTAMGQSNSFWPDIRQQLYGMGRDILCAAGYRQISMRMFQLRAAESSRAPQYCCQEDGMIGLGCGARSYTRALHYSWPYAVSCNGVRSVLKDYADRTEREFEVASYGYQLDAEDQRRRYLIQSLLMIDGLFLQAYRDRFDLEAIADFRELRILSERGLAREEDGRLHLTQPGIDKSDVIGPWLYSGKVRKLMESFQWS